jgi:hypothetical protein
VIKAKKKEHTSLVCIAFEQRHDMNFHLFGALEMMLVSVHAKGASFPLRVSAHVYYAKTFCDQPTCVAGQQPTPFHYADSAPIG